MDYSNMWDEMMELGIASEKEMTPVCNILGFCNDTLEKILYARTGYETIEQYKDGDHENEL